MPQPLYLCHIHHTWDGWTPVRASSPALAAIDYYQSLPEELKENKTIYVLKHNETPRVDSPRVFYVS